MRVVVAVNDRFARTPDGAVWTNASNTCEIFSRYLAVFDEVRVAARVRRCEPVGGEWRRVDGERVGVVELPHFVGVLEYGRRYRELSRIAAGAVPAGCAVILRMPAWHLTGVFASRLRRQGHPYAVEVLNDPEAVLGGPLSGWIRAKTARACRGACSALYVTEQALQERYPPGAEARAFGCSDIDLRDEHFVEGPRSLPESERPSKLVFVGSLERLHKGLDVLLRALRRLEGARLQVIGGGRKLEELRRLAEQLGVSSRVEFAGQLASGEAVRRGLDRADLFVLPSRGEGLPRALVEAMARGLPCIATRVGGMPELLPPEDLVEPGRPEELAARIREILADRGLRERMSERNLAVARRYHEEALSERRIEFLRDVRAKTAARPGSSGSPGSPSYSAVASTASE